MLRFSILFALFSSFIFISNTFAETGCYVERGVQGVDDNTFYLDIHPSGSFDYAGAQYHPNTPNCIDFTGIPCKIYREPEGPFPNGPNYDTGEIVNYSQNQDCDLDDFVFCFLLIPAVFVAGKIIKSHQMA